MNWNSGFISTDHSRSATASGAGFPGRDGSAIAASAIRRSAADGARPSADQNTRSTTAPVVVAGAGAGHGPPGTGGTRRPMFGSASKMKKRSDGLSVDPISARELSASNDPRNRVKPRPLMSYTSLDE